MENPDQPGNSEGFYCSVDFNEYGILGSNIQVGTLAGMPNLKDIYDTILEPHKWCSNRDADCKVAEELFGWTAYEAGAEEDIEDLYGSTSVKFNQNKVVFG